MCAYVGWQSKQHRLASIDWVPALLDSGDDLVKLIGSSNSEPCVKDKPFDL